jgi:hypothetical protein
MDLFYNDSVVKIENLEQYHTKQLLKILKMVRHINWNRPNGYDWDYIEILKNKLREILSTREHVPNKKESREIRLEKIKHGR